MKYKFIFIYIFFFTFPKLAISQNSKVEIGIDEQLGAFLPLDTEFINSEGEKLKLGDVINKPTLLAFVYYECPGICSTTLSSLAWVVDKVDLTPGKDFNVITISIDNGETPEIAKGSKENYLGAIQRKFPSKAWLFLTGDSLAIKKVTDIAGVHFKKYGDEYRHPGGIIAVSPQGKISRYLFGTEFNQFDVKMALLDAEAGKTNPTITKFLKLCFSFDPKGHSYKVNVTRIVGAIMLTAILLYFVFLIFFKSKKIPN